ncbi:hypothetical protein H6P81_013381 [Aristolochia fimbriata]|uniref:Uncharacterized protein n=1 Tax=Aristolochia fimbriata TaxID=158543 RepID=A0AAV7EET7_ARIFI|nr:hypothetical protein H6P81_013381 [Aristolochia fimbriata]
MNEGPGYRAAAFAHILMVRTRITNDSRLLLVSCHLLVVARQLPLDGCRLMVEQVFKAVGRPLRALLLNDGPLLLTSFEHSFVWHKYNHSKLSTAHGSEVCNGISDVAVTTDDNARTPTCSSLELFASGLNGVIYAWDRRLSHYAGSLWKKNIRRLPTSQRAVELSMKSACHT